MLKKKQIRDKGKVRFSEYFKKLNNGDRVAVVRELAEQPRFPKRLQGKVGVVEGVRGRAYLVRIKEYDSEKVHLIKPIHLKRLK